jgi:tetratricopeptide (TPR) repeat protein
MRNFAEAVAINADNADLWRYWGDVLAGRGERTEAIAKYQKAIEINPTLIDAYVGEIRSLVVASMRKR